MNEPHDWPRIIQELEAAGWTVHKIAERLKRQYIQIKRIKDGGRVTYPLDFELLELHEAACSTGNLTIVGQESDNEAKARALFARMREANGSG